MAKTATVSDQIQMCVGGRWIWKEDPPALEFISNNPNADRKDKLRGQRKNAVHFQDAKRQDRGATPSLGSRALGLNKGRTSRVAGQKSPRQNKSRHSHVTLDDVKAVALAMLSEVEIISPSFEGIFATEQFDEFLRCLLNFFQWFFEKRAHEQKPNPMNIPEKDETETSEPSLAEKKYHADLIAKMEAAQKLLGQSYCVLVLGIGMEFHHHMACGESRVSSTYKDRSMYETLYSFCIFVVWIAFRRKEYENVKRELGRMLRSDTFNPAIRVKNAPEQETIVTDEDGNVIKKEEKKLTPAEYRRIHGKRPAIKSIINQKSPALVSIMPSPKEEAHWLFEKGIPLSQNPVEDEDSLDTSVQTMSLKAQHFKIGIIGEPLSQFNAVTLTPVGADNDEEDADGEEKSARRDSQIGSTPHKTAEQAPVSRQTTAISTATTEAPSDDE